MSKQVTVQELIANIAAHLADVKNGETLTIVENGAQVATMTPFIEHQGVKYPFRDLTFGPRPETLKTDPTQIVREDRDYETKKYGF